MGEKVPRSYLWLEKLVGDRCRELRDGEREGEKEDGAKEGGKDNVKDTRSRKEKDRDSKDRSWERTLGRKVYSI